MNAAGVDIGKRRFTIASVPMGEKRPVPAVVTVHTKIKDPLAAAAFLASRLRFYLEEAGPFMAIRSVWLEEPWGKSSTSIKDLSIVLGFLAAQFPSDVAIATVSPDEWRKTLGLPMRAHQAELKEAAAQYVKAATSDGREVLFERTDDTKRLITTGFDYDESDAIAIALACKHEQESPLAARAVSR